MLSRNFWKISIAGSFVINLATTLYILCFMHQKLSIRLQQRKMYLSQKHFPKLNLLPSLPAYHIMWKMRISEGEKYK